ncbi:hypothetical protein HYQ45_001981 [Verticillium longisporum]|uniref:Ubiquitin-like domain-containing protein n=1 Tax=Verticillium longisporum TaxID=100787 RepID=A0A8I2ZZ04_VERLO|nr:hypothetical protein HYQ45_001981 [Verticillium longisporum]RBQ84090.1 hypothetical protein VDGD_04679 [Verticillium dahliae]
MSSDSSSSSVADGPPAPTPTSAPVPADLPYDQLTVSLNIISPTTTATSGGPLSFPDLSISTTISQLKEKIRNAIPSKPADIQQRLIYRGRHLQADNDTLGQIIGEATIREHSLQAFHLVLRGIPDAPAPTPSVLRGRIATPGEARPFTTQAQTQNPRQQSPLGAPTPEAARRTAGFAIPTAPNFTPQQVQQMHSQLHQSMSAWSSGLQREAVNRAMANHQINHNQSARAAMGMHGIGDNGAPTTGPSQRDVSRGRSPGGQPYTRTVVREGTLGDGQPYRVTNTETWTPLSVSDVQGILRGADAGQATQAMTNAMQRSESPGPGALPFGLQPGASTPYYPTMGSRAASRSRSSQRGTPDPVPRSVSEGHTVNAHTSSAQPPAQSSGPEVYILSSPQGPRALLINNTSNETYYTPSLRLPVPDPAAAFARFAPRGRSPQHSPWPTGPFTIPPTTQPFQAPQQQEIQPQPQNQQQQQQQQPQNPQWQAPPHGLNEVPIGALPAHPNNPRLAPLIAQMLPHFWLVVRLGVFIWWFTSPNSSWSRWATVIAIAISIFIVNTGLFDAYFDRIVAPMRRHLDNLLPLANNNHNNNPPNNADLPGNPDDQRAPAAAQHNGPLDPAQAAARLVARRRHDNTTWLMEQARRLERAGLLFLASIAPGVAERHIAHLEEQERAERQRREEAEAAATAAAAAANGEPEAAAENAEANTGGVVAQNEPSASAGPADGQQGNDQPAERREAEPLIAV